MNEEIVIQLRAAFDQAPDKVEFLNDLREWIHKDLSPFKDQPIDFVRWEKIEGITPNDYNPNSVAVKEMSLLKTSIVHDGYTQPIVTIRNLVKRIFEIVDGFHRYFTGKESTEIRESVQGYLPIVVIAKDINDRMASTIRHNRARGTHSITGMSNMVFAMLDNGWKDEDICNELGMEPEELLKLKHITGFSKLFSSIEYKKSWVTKQQILLEKKVREEQAN